MRSRAALTPKPRPWHLSQLALVTLTLMLAACAAEQSATSIPSGSPDTAAVTDEAETPEVTASPVSTASQPPGAAFEVEVDGLTIVGHCSGSRDDGEPAVILFHANGGSQDNLRVVEQQLSDRTQVCSYDRPGGAGGSERPAQRPRAIADIAVEAREVMVAAGVAPPYFLVGQSAGAALAGIFAHLYPDEVAGFVASNPGPPYEAWMAAVSEVASQAEIESLERPDFLGENPEGIDSTGNDIMLEPLPNTMPYAVLFDEDCRMLGYYCDRILQPLADTTALIADAGAGGRFLWVEGAGHEIPDTEPEVLLETIEEIWSETGD